MIIRAVGDIEGIPVTEGGAHGTAIRWLLRDSDGVPNFAMRQFVVQPGGATPRHAHAWEHEVYILKGTCTIFCNGETRRAGSDTAIYIEPNALHSFSNEETEDLVFLCMIPIT